MVGSRHCARDIGLISCFCTRRQEAAFSLPFKKAENEKKGRFGGLIRVAERLAREGFLGFRPFLFPVVSSLGSMNPDMTRMLKWMGDRYKHQLEAAPEREDGISNGVDPKTRAYQARVCFAAPSHCSWSPQSGTD